MKFIENEAIDFICSIKRFAERNTTPDPDRPGIPQIDNWCKSYDKTLSPFLLNDLALLTEKMIAPIIFLWKLVLKDESLTTGEKLLSKLHEMEPEDFFQSMIKVHNLKPENLINPQEISRIITDNGLYPNFDPDTEADFIFSFFKDPNRLQNRLYQTYLDFYEKAYLPGRLELTTLNEKKLAWHNERLALNANEYLHSLGMKEFIQEILNMGEPILYFSLFADTEVTAFLKGGIIIIGGGTDTMIKAQSARDRASLFLSCTGDPKRLEILRLTSVRPWYSTELAQYFDLKPATLSYHINKLVDADLLKVVKGEQRRFYYEIDRKEVKAYLKFIEKDLLGEEGE
jgi:DNA-binding transcriptional ArsR family regulator